MYTVKQQGSVRIIEMSKNDGLKYLVYKLDTKKRVKLENIGNKIGAYFTGEIVVYKYPHCNVLHFERMNANRRYLTGGGSITEDQLVENLLECVEII